MRVLSLVAVSRGYSLLWCEGFSLEWLLLLWSTGSRRGGFRSCGSRAPEHRISNCGARAYLLRDMWDLPGPGLEPVSPASAGGFSTTAPPGKPRGAPLCSFKWCFRYKLLSENSGSFQMLLHCFYTIIIKWMILKP